MPENNTLNRSITVDMVHEALNLACFHYGTTVEAAEPACDWPRLCGSSCQFPRYHRGGLPVGLTAQVLIELGYPTDLLKELDREYEMSEVLHPGVKIARSRNLALRRIEPAGLYLLAFLQDNQKNNWSWNKIAETAFKPRWMIKRLDARRRPWLY